MSRHSKVIARMEETNRQTHTQTDRQYENITFPHTWAVTVTIAVPIDLVTNALRSIKANITFKAWEHNKGPII